MTIVKNGHTKREWLKKHGKFSKVWFCEHAWMSHGGLIVESDEEYYIDDLYDKVKKQLLYRVNNPRAEWNDRGSWKESNG